MAKRAMRQYVENVRSTPDEKVSNDTKNSWNQVKIFMQEEEGIYILYTFLLVGMDYTDLTERE